MAAPSGSEVWRDYVTNGIPSSGANNPKKSDIRSWASWLESLVTSGVLSSGPWFATKAVMSLGYAANTIAIVYNDPAPSNNGLYIKSGASGSGSWNQLTSFLPGYQFVTASPTGESTPNAIVAATSPRLPAGDGVALVTLVFPATNTASPVTVRFDGGAALSIKTRTGENPDAGELQQNDVVAGFVSGSTFRLISDLNSLRNFQSAKAWANNDEDVPVPANLGGDGLTTFSAKHWAEKSNEDADRSEVARTGAEAARDIAAGYASDAVSQGNVPIYATVVGLSGILVPAGINVIRLNGFASADDLAGGAFASIPAPSVAEVWHIQDAAGRWFELLPIFPSNAFFKRASANDTAGFEAFVRYLVAKKKAGYLTEDMAIANASYVGTNNGEFPSTERLTIFGAGGRISSQAPGYTVTIEGVFCPRFEGVEFVGTADADGGVYNSANPQTGLYLNHCSMPQVIGCRFSRFSGFPIWVDRNQPATRHQGAVIERNNFIGNPYDPAVPNQACIFLGDNGEYTRIAFNTMENCPQFVRAVGGANSEVLFNNIMGSNVTDTATDNLKGLICFTAGPTNEGKISVIGNSINHNETKIWAINIAGSGAADTLKNANNISDNKILVHGSELGCESIRVRNYNRNIIKGNHLRSKNTAPPGYAVWLDNCKENTLSGNNFEEYGDFAVRLFGGSSIFEDGNSFESKATAYSLQSAADSIRWRTRRSITCRVAGDGVLAAGCDASNLGWIVAKTGTGTYTVTHSFGSAIYSVLADLDGANGRITTVRNANTIDVSVFNTSNAAADAAFNLLVCPWDSYLRPIF